MKVALENLSSMIMQELEDYADVVTESVEEAAEETAKEAVTDLRQTSPQKTGKYAKSWAQKKTKDGKGRVIYAKAPEYRKTHLLEKGHAKRGGGRVEAIPHIKPVEEQSIKAFEERIRQKI